MTDHQDTNQRIKGLTEEDDLWGTYDEDGLLFSVHRGPEPEFPQDEGLTQVNFTKMTAHDISEIVRMKNEIWDSYRKSHEM